MVIVDGRRERDIEQCTDCGRIFRPRPESKGLCGYCDPDYQEPEMAGEEEAAPEPEPDPRERQLIEFIAYNTGLSVEAIQEALTEATPAPMEGDELFGLCEQCGERPRLMGKTRCIRCQLQLRRVVEAAASEVKERIHKTPEPERPTGGANHLLESVRQKRSRTASDRFDVSGGQRLKY